MPAFLPSRLLSKNGSFAIPRLIPHLSIYLPILNEVHNLLLLFPGSNQIVRQSYWEIFKLASLTTYL